MMAFMGGHAAFDQDKALGKPDEDSPRLILLLPGNQAGEKGLDIKLVKRRKFLRKALWDAFSHTGLFVERLLLDGNPNGKKGEKATDWEAWVLGISPAGLLAAAESEGIQKRQEFNLKTPDGSLRTFQQWADLTSADQAEEEKDATLTQMADAPFSAAHVLVCVHCYAFRALLPKDWTPPPDSDEFKKLIGVCTANSVLSLAIHDGVVTTVTAMHDSGTVDSMMEAFKHPLEGGLANVLGGGRPEVLAQMVTYFGIHTAEYVMFLNEYAAWLTVPGIAGILVQLHHMFFCAESVAIYTTGPSHLFMIFMNLWSTMFLEHWKRRRSMFFHKHGFNEGGHQRRAQNAAPAKFQIGNDVLVDAFSMTTAAAGSSSSKDDKKLDQEDEAVADEAGLTGALALFPFLFPAILMTVLASSVVFVVMALLWVSDYAGKNFENVALQNAPIGLYIGVTTVMEGFFVKGVDLIVGMEHHALYSGHLKSTASKLLFFQLVNYLSWFFFIAFRLQDLTYLRAQLLMFMTIKSAIGIAKEVVVPNVIKRITGDKKADANTVARKTEPDSKDKEKSEDATDAEGLRQRGLARQQSGSNAKLSSGQSLEEAVPIQLKLEPTDIGSEYQQLAITFALTSSFAIVFPLGPILAFIHAWVSGFTDPYKFLTMNMRSPPGPMDVIISDTWIDVLEGISMISVMSNIGLLAVEEYSGTGSHWNIGALILLEHAQLIFKAYLAWVVPDTPEKMERDVVEFEKLLRWNKMQTEKSKKRECS